MNHTGAGAIMTGTMPAQPEGMTVKELLARMKANDVPSGYALSKLLGVSPSTTSRWLRGLTRIDTSAAALVRERLTKPPKK